MVDTDASTYNHLSWYNQAPSSAHDYHPIGLPPMLSFSAPISDTYNILELTTAQLVHFTGAACRLPVKTVIFIQFTYT